MNIYRLLHRPHPIRIVSARPPPGKRPLIAGNALFECRRLRAFILGRKLTGLTHKHNTFRIWISVSDLAIIPIQDFLMYGSDTRINTPGVASGNWSYRVTKEQLDRADIGFFKSLNKIYRR